MMTRYALLAVLLCVLLVAATPVRADLLEEMGASTDGRIRMLTYNPNQVYSITTRIGYQTYIEFSAQEEIQTISIGERSYWQLIPAGNRLFLRPMRPDVATNMTVITNRYAYQFDVSSAPEEEESAPKETKDVKDTKDTKESDNAGKSNDGVRKRVAARALSKVVYVARFVYPEPPKPKPMVMPASMPALVMAQPQPVAPIVLTPPAPALKPESARNYLYSTGGAQASAPYEVFDDGKTTYFRYKDPNYPMPRVAMLDEGGHETPFAVYTSNGYFAVNTVAPVLLLRSQGDTVFVYNESLAPHP